MTRWHEDDLAGRLLASEGSQWEVLKFPAIDAEGKALWPQKYPVSELNKIKKFRRTWTALYQQEPVPEEGGLLKRAWLGNRYSELPPDREGYRGRWEVVLSVDAAYKTGIANDYSVIGAWGTDGINFYLLDVWRERVEYPELKRAIEQRFRMHNARMVLIEDAAAGISLIQEMRRTSSIPLIAVPAKGSKSSRLEAVTPIFEAGKVWLPANASWVEEYVEEMISFPNAMFDDQADMTSIALGRLASRAEANEIVIDMATRVPSPYPVGSMRERFIGARNRIVQGPARSG